MSVVYTSVFWRNAWKYQSRAYRHAYWDSGTVLANTLSVASSRGLPTRVVTGFADDAVNRVLDVDGVREAAVAIVPVGSGGTDVATTPAPERVNLETLPYSPKEIDYPLIRATHAATSLDEAGAAAWRSLEGSAQATSKCANASRCGGGVRRTRDPPSRLLAAVPACAHRQPHALRSMLAAAMRPVPGDWPSLDGAPVNDLYLIVNAVDGLAPGGYVYHAEGGELEMLHSGDHRFMAGAPGAEPGAGPRRRRQLLLPHGPRRRDGRDGRSGVPGGAARREHSVRAGSICRHTPWASAQRASPSSTTR